MVGKMLQQVICNRVDVVYIDGSGGEKLHISRDSLVSL